MVRETRYLWVGNLPEKASEERTSEVFARHGKIQSVKLLASKDDGAVKSAVVAFMDIRSASKAQNSENKLDGNVLQTQYSEPSAVGSGVTVTRTPAAANAASSTPSSASAHDAPSSSSSSNRTLFSQQSRPIAPSRYSGRSGGESG
ncbi:hypothetical protein CAPTEDRAFT_212696 [Capitella teleta]|uniref:RRM domain-containing protein n=1 Tax=Capitella teleta TaxID=283909 RepID=R7UIV7_CAPTE|nr:hypothetical protein CAPTEDRAFT_212696 [Capitella teleta]|eukprot:ELU06100.1 hypothetical protein CAPTEDRAFT_212696 [Capitella teleta]